MTMANPFVHLELATPDLAKAKEFYGEPARAAKKITLNQYCDV